MKRILISALILGMCISMAGCTGNQNSSVAEKATEAVTKAVTEKATTKAKVSATEAKKVDYDYDNDNDYDYDNDVEEYYCMGKNDTCPNKTSSPWDLYCHSCDPDNDNIEG